MSDKERRYLVCLTEVRAGKLSLAQAAINMAVSYRQASRLWKRFLENDDAGLVHQLRGRPSTHQTPPDAKAAVLARYQERYADFGPTLAAEHLTEKDGLPVHRETLRLWLIEAGLRKTRTPRKEHRTWRAPKARFGQMLQIDGSIHDWFEGRGAPCFLMSAVDDATGRCHLLFSEQETTWAALDLLRGWVERYGCPQSVYVDRKNVYVTEREQTREEQLAGTPALTKFGNVCHKLGIAVITAHSPQAKGRVERKHAVCQDRLIKEMRLAGINSIDAANAFLSSWIDPFNEKFARAAREEGDAHRAVAVTTGGFSLFCLEETRTVARDYTVRLDNVWYQIRKQSEMPSPGDKVLVLTDRDGVVQVVRLSGKTRVPLLVDRLAEAPLKPAVVKAVVSPRIPHKPSPDHPWRRSTPTGVAPRAAEITAVAASYLPDWNPEARTAC